MHASSRQPRSPVAAALARCKRHLVAAAAFSAASNLLYLTPSIFMLQVYDRVVPSRSIATLVALGVVALAALAALVGFDWLRQRVLVRASARIEAELAEPALRAALNGPALSRLSRVEAVQHLETLRQGIASPAMIAALDAPWTPIYILVGYLLHPLLGITIAISGLVLLGLAWVNERATTSPMKRATEAAGQAYARQNYTATYAAEVRALGMVGALARLQADERGIVNRLHMRASFVANSHGSSIKFLRLALQSGALALGATLVIEGSISASSMMAASLLMARALAPVEQIVAAWKTIVQVRVAHDRLGQLFYRADAAPDTLLPQPTGALLVERVTVTAPLSERRTLDGISFAVDAGQVVGIVGHSGAGKSTLLRAMAGAIDLAGGHVRLDGASRTDWDPERLAQHIGYLPQEPILFPGTVKENIVRFRHLLGESQSALDEAAIAAAQAIGVHDTILRLPQGYDTPVGAGGVGLSIGQAQRVAIARALFGDPAVLLLDEPTAHLDADAQRALASMLARQRERGVTVLFATHSTDLLAHADQLLVLAAGRMERFGPIGARPPAPNWSPSAPITFAPAKA